MKRGQLSLFFMIGLVLVIVVAFVLQVSQHAPDQPVISAQLRPVQQAIESCLQQRLEGAVALAGAQGGYVLVPETVPAIPLENVFVPYWWESGNAHALTQEQAEQQLSDYLRAAADGCAAPTVQGFSITKHEPATASVVIAPDSVTAYVTLPVTATLGDASYRMDAFSVTTKTPLGAALEQAREVTRRLAYDKTAIDITLLLSFPTHNTVFNHTRRDKIIVMEQTPRPPTGAFAMAFAVRLDRPTDNRPPVVEELPDVQIGTSETLRLPIRAYDPEGGAVLFDIISNEFTITSDGIVTIHSDTPGYFVPTIRVADEDGLAEYVDLKVTIA